MANGHNMSEMLIGCYVKQTSRLFSVRFREHPVASLTVLGKQDSFESYREVREVRFE